MKIFSRIFSYPLLLAQLAHERADRKRERRQLRVHYERQLALVRKERDDIWLAYNRVIDRIGQKSGMLPIFEDRPEPKEQTKEQKEFARSSPIKRTVMAGEQRADKMYDAIKGEVAQYVQERKEHSPQRAENQ